MRSRSRQALVACDDSMPAFGLSTIGRPAKSDILRAKRTRSLEISISSDSITVLHIIGGECCRFCRPEPLRELNWSRMGAVSYTHLRAHEPDSYLVCRLLLEKK